MHKDLILRFIEVQAIILSPICPHFAEKVWKLLGKSGLAIRDARWPVAGPVDSNALAQDTYLEVFIILFYPILFIYFILLIYL